MGYIGQSGDSVFQELTFSVLRNINIDLFKVHLFIIYDLFALHNKNVSHTVRVKLSFCQ